MPLDTYANLQKAVMDWLARPDDPLISPALPEMVQLFEAEARLRLRTLASEAMAELYASTGTQDLALPSDFAELRSAMLQGLASPLHFISAQASAPYTVASGVPRYYTIYGGGDWACSADDGAFMRLSPPPAGPYTVNIAYLRGLPALSDAAPTNWLLLQSPGAYLWGVLVEAEAYIGHDERAAAWLQRRDAALAGLEIADRKARWGGPLQMRVDGATP
jgi:hypothetical protein